MLRVTCLPSDDKRVCVSLSLLISLSSLKKTTFFALERKEAMNLASSTSFGTSASTCFEECIGLRELRALMCFFDTTSHPSVDVAIDAAEELMSVASTSSAPPMLTAAAGGNGTSKADDAWMAMQAMIEAETALANGGSRGGSRRHPGLVARQMFANLADFAELDLEQFTVAAQTIAPQCDTSAIRRFFFDVDTDRTGGVSWNEVSAYLLSRGQLRSVAQ